MAKYFLHLRDGTDELLDPDGKEYHDLTALRSAVLTNARDCIAGDVRTGVIDLRYRIDAEDGEGTLVYSLPFQHAFSIIPPSA
jgi:hypothetical protein